MLDRGEGRRTKRIRERANTYKNGENKEEMGEQTQRLPGQTEGLEPAAITGSFLASVEDSASAQPPLGFLHMF